MILGTRMRKLREARNLSLGDIQERTGMMRSYISRVENGHVVPSLENLERLAAAIEVPLYRLFYEGDDLRSLTAESGAGEERSHEMALFERIRRLEREKSGASGDARLAFRTLARVFSKL